MRKLPTSYDDVKADRDAQGSLLRPVAPPQRGQIDKPAEPDTPTLVPDKPTKKSILFG